MNMEDMINDIVKNFYAVNEVLLETLADKTISATEALKRMKQVNQAENVEEAKEIAKSF